MAQMLLHTWFGLRQKCGRRIVVLAGRVGSEPYAAYDIGRGDSGVHEQGYGGIGHLVIKDEPGIQKV